MFCEYVNDLHLRRELYLAGHSVHILWHQNGYTNTFTLTNSVPFSFQMIIIYLSISIFEVHTIQIGKMPDQPTGQLSTSTSRHSWTLKYTYDLLRKKGQFQQLQIIEINQNIAFKGKKQLQILLQIIQINGNEPLNVIYYLLWLGSKLFADGFSFHDLKIHYIFVRRWNKNKNDENFNFFIKYLIENKNKCINPHFNE